MEGGHPTLHSAPRLTISVTLLGYPHGESDPLSFQIVPVVPCALELPLTFVNFREVLLFLFTSVPGWRSLQICTAQALCKACSGYPCWLRCLQLPLSVSKGISFWVLEVYLAQNSIPEGSDKILIYSFARTRRAVLILKMLLFS